MNQSYLESPYTPSLNIYSKELLQILRKLQTSGLLILGNSFIPAEPNDARKFHGLVLNSGDLRLTRDTEGMRTVITKLIQTNTYDSNTLLARMSKLHCDKTTLELDNETPIWFPKAYHENDVSFVDYVKQTLGIDIAQHLNEQLLK